MRLFLILILFFFSPSFAQAQAADPPRAAVKAPDAHRTAGKKGPALPPEKARPVRVPRFVAPPEIDGRLDDEAWKGAAVLKDFYQTNPGDNIAPSYATEVMVGYDAKRLYLAFHAYDDPSKVRANIANRDEIFDDDTVQVMLDTFNDRRKAYTLGFNPFGVQADGIVSEGRGEDYSLDILMESKGALTADGYVVEVAIPFKSLRYEAGEGKLWGVHFFRQIKRLNDENNSWMPISRDESNVLDQAGHITGLEGISTERNLEIIPSLTLSETGRRLRTLPVEATASNPGLIDPGRLLNKPIKADPGVTVKLGLTPTVTLDFAANPDFAQVEADQPVVTANQRFPIFFAEKRPFFLEGIDLFQTPIQAVHTRAIIDPDYAVKLSGKRGRNSFGLLLASDNAPGDFTEEERSDPSLLPDIGRFIGKNALVGVLRLKRDVGKESSLGLIATSYDFIERHNHLGGVDGRLRIDKKTVLSFQVLGTTSRRFFSDAELGRDVYRTGNALAYYWEYDYTGRNFGYQLNAQGRTKDYVADVGFTVRTNTNRNGAFFRFSSDPRPKASFIGWRILSFNSANYDWQGRLQGWDNGLHTELEFARNTSMSFSLSHGYERIFEEEFGPKRAASRAGAFFGDDAERSSRWGSLGISVSTNPSDKYSLFAFAGRSFNAFDFDFGAGPRFPRVSPAALLNPEAALDPGLANGVDLNIGFAYKPTKELNTNFSYTKSRLVRLDTDRVAFDDNIFSSATTYQFTRYTFVRARVDYDTLASSVRGQYLFGWTPNPGTSLYVGYNDDLSFNGFSPFTNHLERGFRRNSRTFFIKSSYLIRRSI